LPEVKAQDTGVTLVTMVPFKVIFLLKNTFFGGDLCSRLYLFGGYKDLCLVDTNKISVALGMGIPSLKIEL